MLKRCLFIGLAMMLLVGVIGFIACGAGGISGSYVCTKGGEEWLGSTVGNYYEFNSDGTFYLGSSKGGGGVGEWKLEGDEITFTAQSFGTTIAWKGKIKEDTIVLEDGSTWVKQNSSPEEEEVVLTPEPTVLEHMLGYVPNIEKYKSRISFADPGGANRLLGIGGFTRLSDLEDMPVTMEEMSLEQKNWWLNVEYVTLGAGRQYVFLWSDVFGYTYLQAERSIKAGVPADDFIVHEGSFDEGLIGTKLVELGYKRLDFLSIPYYALEADYGIDLTGPTNFALNSMNRVALFDDTIVCTRATGLLIDVLEAVKGQHPSLQDVPAYAGLAQGMGGVTLAEVLTEEEVREILLRARQEMLEMGEVWELSSWGKLHQYQLAGMGFRYHEGERFLVISLFYEDGGAATRDEYELRQRLGTYVRTNGLPATDYWQVSSSKVLYTHGGSVLTIECKLIWEFQRAQIVSELLLYGDIIFLAVDASDF